MSTSSGKDAAVEFPLIGQPLGIDFANTLIAIRGRPVDMLTQPGGIAAWLKIQEHRLGAWPAPKRVDHLVQLRDAVRRVLEATSRRVRPGETDIDLLHAAVSAGEAYPRIEWIGGDPHLTFKAKRLPGLIAAHTTALVSGPDAARVRRCGNPRCVLFFLARNRRQEYCSAACAVRGRAARHYASR